MTTFNLDALAILISERSTAAAAKSYTKSLLEAGTHRVAKKFGEEAVEAVIAAMQKDQAGLTSEAADVLYHLLVLLHDGGVPLQNVMVELERRTSQSGHEEKASRPS